MIVFPDDGSLLGRPELTIAMGQLRIRQWFWALSRWEFFLAERTFHQVMSVYRVPRDSLSPGLSFESIVLDNPAYATSSFDAYVDTSRDFATWFTESSVGPIIERERS